MENARERCPMLTSDLTHAYTKDHVHIPHTNHTYAHKTEHENTQSFHFIFRDSCRKAAKLAQQD